MKTTLLSLTTLLLMAFSLRQNNDALETNATFTKIDGKLFTTVTIGEQTWMAENLNVDKFKNGDLIPEAKTKEEWEKLGNEGKPAWCYYDFDAANGKLYGKLYNGYAVLDARGLAPEGFSIPTKEDLTILIDFYGGKDKAGIKLKSNKGWEEGYNGESTSTEFYALPSGYYFNGFFQDKGNETMIWSQSAYFNSVENHNDDLVMLPLHYNYKIAYLSNQSKYNGCSVRCIKK
jgi:uncharacterized protein (TIGR02145 family)